MMSEEEERLINDNESVYKSKTDNHIKCRKYFFFFFLIKQYHNDILV